MKIKEGYQLCKIRNSSVVIAVGDAVMDFNGLVTLNETGEFIWERLQNEKSDKEIISDMVNEFGISDEVAEADFYEFANKLKGAGFIE